MPGRPHRVDAAAAVPGTVVIDPPLAGTPGPEAPACLLVPSAAHVLQAAWLAALAGGSWLGLGDWLRGELDAAEAHAGRYDLALRALVAERGADRVVLVVGADPGEVEAAIDGLGAPGLRLGDVRWPRLLDGAELALVDSWLDQLADLGLTGPTAADLVAHAAERLPASDGSPAPAWLPADVAALVERRTAEWAAEARGAGARVVGDVEALVWRPGTPSVTGEGAVPVGTATALAVGVLERTLEWAADRPRERREVR